MKLHRLSPIRLFLLVLAIVFAAETLVMFVLPVLLPHQPPGTAQALVDSCLLTALSAPLLWWLIVRPLRRLAVLEQAKSQALAAATSEGIISFTHRGIIESFSPAAEQVFGYAASEILGEDLETLIPWRLLVTGRRAWGEGSAPQPLSMGAIRIFGRRKDGSEVPLSLSIREVPVDAAPLYTAVVRDLADRERDELRAEQMAAVAQLGAAFAHRLRNPLTSIKMLVQAGSRENESLALDKEDLRIMADEVRRMERSVQVFLDFARPRKPDCRPLVFASLVRETVEQAELRAAQKKITVQLTLCDDACSISADAQQLRELVNHLLCNAVEASSPGGAVQVGLRRPDARHIALSVCDSGPGLPPERLAQLFQPFATTKATGTGLGLVLCRRIAEDHGGTLAAFNRADGGACFTLTLPAEARPCETTSAS